jgi:hypothetical protein
MKKLILPILLLAIVLTSCKKKLKFTEIELETARSEVKQFYDDYPDYVYIGADSVAVSEYYTVYAVKFDKDDQKLSEYFPDLDFSEIESKYTKDDTGIRIYHAISELGGKKHPSVRFVNYVTFTKPSGSGKAEDDDDTLRGAYLIENHQLDLRRFRESREYKPHHLSCAPNCPEVSLLKQKTNKLPI